MALLTREERQTLSRDERRELRAARRRKRSEKRSPGDGAKLDEGKLNALVETLVVDYAGQPLSRDDRIDEVLDELADELDSYLVWTWAGPAWPILEIADGPAVRALVRVFLRPLVERVDDLLGG